MRLSRSIIAAHRYFHNAGDPSHSFLSHQIMGCLCLGDISTENINVFLICWTCYLKTCSCKKCHESLKRCQRLKVHHTARITQQGAKWQTVMTSDISRSLSKTTQRQFHFSSVIPFDGCIISSHFDCLLAIVSYFLWSYFILFYFI